MAKFLRILSRNNDRLANDPGADSNNCRTKTRSADCIITYITNVADSDKHDFENVDVESTLFVNDQKEEVPPCSLTDDSTSRGRRGKARRTIFSLLKICGALYRQVIVSQP